MQIHELPLMPRIPTTSDSIPIDDGSVTYRVGPDDFGVRQEMTLQEAMTGSVTDPRVVTPAVMHDIASVLILDAGTISSLPATITNANITADMVCLKADLGTPSAQTSDWTVTTSAGSLVLSGTISGSTTLNLYLINSR